MAAPVAIGIAPHRSRFLSDHARQSAASPAAATASSAPIVPAAWKPSNPWPAKTGTCPTCGNSIVIPILDYRGRLIDPTSGQVIKQDPHPVHAYAAAGHKAPQIVVVEGSEDHFIRCPRCNRNNTLTANNCLGCGLPFTMEGTVGDAVSGTNTWAVASLVLGIVSIPGFCFFPPPILAIIFGVLGLRTTNQATGRMSGRRAWRSRG